MGFGSGGETRLATLEEIESFERRKRPEMGSS